MSDDKISSLGAARTAKAQDNRLWTPVECLRDCIEDIEAGRVKCDKLFVIRVDTSDEQFNVGYNAAKIKASEIIAAMVCAQAQVLTEMGYLT